MDEMFLQILYMGAGKHIEVTTYFPNCKKFIFIDILPRNEYDDLFDIRLCHKTFVKDIVTKFLKFNFILIATQDLDEKYYNNTAKLYYMDSYNTAKLNYMNPYLFEFYNHKTDTLIKYYMSTNILFNMNNILKNDIYNCDCIFNCGYHPNEYLKELLNTNITFVGCNTTCYKTDEFNFNNFNFNNYFLIFKNKDELFIKYDKYNNMNEIINAKEGLALK